MSLCSGIRADGGRCKALAMNGTEYCLNHHPDKAEQRRRRASKGGKKAGRGRPLTDVGDAKKRLSKLAEDVLKGKVNRALGSTTAQILNVYLRAIDIELRAKEQEELVGRLEEIESQLEEQGDAGDGWRGGYHPPG